MVLLVSYISMLTLSLIAFYEVLNWVSGATVPVSYCLPIFKGALSSCCYEQ